MKRYILFALLLAWLILTAVKAWSLTPGDWDFSHEITIDSSKVSSNLSNFPVALELSDSCGQSDTDMTAIFDEIGANSLKLAVGDTSNNDLYVEIEHWDNTNEKATLWVKVTSISSSADTTITLYWDNDHADNSTYVGATNSTACDAVWDSNFEAVYHLATDPNGDPSNGMYDSTSNDGHGTPSGTMTTADLVDADVGKGIEFDGSDDYIDFGTTIPAAEPGFTFTVEACFYPTTNSMLEDGILSTCRKSNRYYGQWLLMGSYNGSTANRVGCQYGDGTGDGSGDRHGYCTDDYFAANNQYSVIAATCSAKDTWSFYGNGSARTSYSFGGTASSIGWDSTDGRCVVGNSWSSFSKYMHGRISEVRISNIDRGASWINATAYTLLDDFVDYGGSGGLGVDAVEDVTDVDGLTIGAIDGVEP